MTVKLSQQKISRLLKYYFAGITQPAIAQRVNTDQSTISLYSKRFSERAAEIGLLEAAKEYQVYSEVSRLRNLSVEMQKYNLTTEDALHGIRIEKAFDKLGVATDQHIKLIQVCKKINDPGFVDAALELVRIEAESNISYEEAVAKYDTAVSQLPAKQNEMTQLQAKLDSLNSTISERNEELQLRDTEVERAQKEAETKKASLEQEYQARRKQLEVKQQEIEDVAQLKAGLSKDNLDIATLVKVVKEYRHGTQKVNGRLIRRAIEEHHSLGKAIDANNNKIALQHKEHTQLKQQNSELRSDNARVASEKAENERGLQNGRLELSQLFTTMEICRRQYTLFQGFLAMLVNSPSVNRPIESLITSLQQVMRSGWYSPRTQKEWMDLFVQRVFGDYLQSFRCDHCGSRFMISEGMNKGYLNYPIKCPRCHNSSWVEPDDSFLRAMVSEDQLTNIYRAELLMNENVILRPFKVLVGIPCDVCGKPISEFTEDAIKVGAAGCGWAHADCWNTFTGKVKMFGNAAKYLLETEKGSSEQAVKNAGK